MKILAQLAGLALVAVAGSASAQTVGVANLDAAVQVVKPIRIEAVTPLSFGRLVANTTNSYYATMGTNGVPNYPGGAIPGGPARSAATFTVTGEPGLSYSFTMPAKIVVTNTAGAGTMDIVELKHTATATPAIPAGGSQTVALGGAIIVYPNQAAGSYTGNFSVTVAYN